MDQHELTLGSLIRTYFFSYKRVPRLSLCDNNIARFDQETIRLMATDFAKRKSHYSD